ncbi:antimicrobial peptide NK-lysin-like protein [Labeo rohita]|uniref:Antimicrobial peptide NK-lysin-like protein n=1 Tax=Labeo rohita TaxID=84645 RepID=A0A498MHL3_LABRO|nr:antimicrobial peptide NK-lysin-like protein [Labeo rohita]
MLRNIFLVSLLVYAVCAAHWEIREVDSAEDQDEDMCDEVKATLNKTREKLTKPLKCLYLHGLIDELKTDDGPDTICTKIHACKPEPPIKEFIVVRDQAHDNF